MYTESKEARLRTYTGILLIPFVLAHGAAKGQPTSTRPELLPPPIPTKQPSISSSHEPEEFLKQIRVNKVWGYDDELSSIASSSTPVQIRALAFRACGVVGEHRCGIALRQIALNNIETIDVRLFALENLALQAAGLAAETACSAFLADSANQFTIESFTSAQLTRLIKLFSNYPTEGAAFGRIIYCAATIASTNAVNSSGANRRTVALSISDKLRSRGTPLASDLANALSSTSAKALSRSLWKQYPISSVRGIHNPNPLRPGQQWITGCEGADCPSRIPFLLGLAHDITNSTTSVSIDELDAISTRIASDIDGILVSWSNRQSPSLDLAATIAQELRITSDAAVGRLGDLAMVQLSRRHASRKHASFGYITDEAWLRIRPKRGPLRTTITSTIPNGHFSANQSECSPSRITIKSRKITPDFRSYWENLDIACTSGIHATGSWSGLLPEWAARLLRSYPTALDDLEYSLSAHEISQLTSRLEPPSSLASLVYAEPLIALSLIAEEQLLPARLRNHDFIDTLYLATRLNQATRSGDSIVATDGTSDILAGYESRRSRAISVRAEWNALGELEKAVRDIPEYKKCHVFDILCHFGMKTKNAERANALDRLRRERDTRRSELDALSDIDLLNFPDGSTAQLKATTLVWSPTHGEQVLDLLVVARSGQTKRVILRAGTLKMPSVLSFEAQHGLSLPAGLRMDLKYGWNAHGVSVGAIAVYGMALGLRGTLARALAFEGWTATSCSSRNTQLSRGLTSATPLSLIPFGLSCDGATLPPNLLQDQISQWGTSLAEAQRTALDQVRPQIDQARRAREAAKAWTIGISFTANVGSGPFNVSATGRWNELSVSLGGIGASSPTHVISPYQFRLAGLQSLSRSAISVDAAFSGTIHAMFNLNSGRIEPLFGSSIVASPLVTSSQIRLREISGARPANVTAEERIFAEICQQGAAAARLQNNILAAQALDQVARLIFDIGISFTYLDTPLDLVNFAISILTGKNLYRETVDDDALLMYAVAIVLPRVPSWSATGPLARIFSNTGSELMASRGVRIVYSRNRAYINVKNQGAGGRFIFSKAGNLPSKEAAHIDQLLGRNSHILMKHGGRTSESALKALKPGARHTRFASDRIALESVDQALRANQSTISEWLSLSTETLMRSRDKRELTIDYKLGANINIGKAFRKSHDIAVEVPEQLTSVRVILKRDPAKGPADFSIVTAFPTD